MTMPPPEPDASKMPALVYLSLRYTGIARGGRGVVRFFTASSGRVVIGPAEQVFDSGVVAWTAVFSTMYSASTAWF
jgi:hypothetical protein